MSVKSILNPIFIISLMVVLLVACNNQTETTETAVFPTTIPPTAPSTLPPTPEATATPELTTREQWRLSLAACCPHLTAAPESLLLALWGLGPDGEFVADVAQAAVSFRYQSERRLALVRGYGPQLAVISLRGDRVRFGTPTGVATVFYASITQASRRADGG